MPIRSCAKLTRPGRSAIPNMRRACRFVDISESFSKRLFFLSRLPCCCRSPIFSTGLPGVGWTQAVDLLARMRTLQIMWNSLILVCGVTTLSLALALPFAWLTERTDLPGWRIWTVLAMMPLVIPSYVGGFALIAMFGPRGVLQELLSPFGVNRLPSIYGFTGALWVLTLFTYPYIFMSIRAALHRFDPSIEEAARSLGYNGWQTFLKVTLPNLRPAITAGGLLVALYTLSDFGAVSLLRFNSFTRAIYVQYLSSFDRNVASLLSLALIVFTIILLVLERNSRGRGRPRYYRSSAGVAAPRKRIELAHRKWPHSFFAALWSRLPLFCLSA